MYLLNPVTFYTYNIFPVFMSFVYVAPLHHSLDAIGLQYKAGIGNIYTVYLLIQYTWCSCSASASLHCIPCRHCTSLPAACVPA